MLLNKRIFSALRPTMLSQMTIGRNFSFAWPCPRKLREVVKMSAFEKETPETCVYLWNEFHHAKPENVATVLSHKQFQLLFSRGKASPMFIHPVPKGEPPNHFILVS